MGVVDLGFFKMIDRYSTSEANKWSRDLFPYAP